MTNPKPTAKRRPFRFSLRTLLIVVVLLSLPLGWLGLKMREAEGQRKAVEAIREAGGDVYYDYHVNRGGYEVWQPEPPASAWLRDLLGVNFFSDAVCVGFEDPKKIDDAVLENYVALGRPERLYHSGTQLTDSLLKHLTDAPNLNSLELGGTLVTDAGLENLRVLGNLKDLDLSGTHVTDAGLEHLRTLTNLNELTLEGTQVTEEGITDLRKALPNCKISWDEPTNNPQDQP